MGAGVGEAGVGAEEGENVRGGHVGFSLLSCILTEAWRDAFLDLDPSAFCWITYVAVLVN